MYNFNSTQAQEIRQLHHNNVTNQKCTSWLKRNNSIQSVRVLYIRKKLQRPEPNDNKITPETLGQ